MNDLRTQLEQCFRGRTCVVGVGNLECTDDGFGVKLAKELSEAGMSNVITVDIAPERYLYQLTTAGFDNVLFLDAVDFGAAPGFVAFLNVKEIEAKFPQISTHKISLGVLARMVEGDGLRHVWLLGVQPKSTSPGQQFSAPVAATYRTLKELLMIAANLHPKDKASGSVA